MSRSNVSRILLVFVATCFICLKVGPHRPAWAQKNQRRPNVVLIMTDNHGAWTLGCYGNRDIRTPNIDQLATEGTLFTRAFASNPVCSPTRATFLTGLLPSQHGVHSFLSGGNLQVGPYARCTLDQITSLPEVLSESGFACGLVGKWHLGDNLRPQEGLDDYWITMPHGGTSTFYNAPVIENGKIGNEPTYLTDLWTEHAIKFIDQQADRDQPFFLFLAYNGPYSLGRLLLQEGRNRHAKYYADKPLTSFPRQSPHPWQWNNRDYINNPTSIRRVATEVSGIDDGVGEVMASLKAHGLDENTIVVFVADQGWVGGHGGFFGMGDHTRPLTARDGMMQIPTIWRQPARIEAGVRSDRMITNYDFMPTLLGQLDLKDRMPESPRSPGTDYSDTLRGEAPEAESKPIFYEFENLRCIRTSSFKYVHRHPNGPHELFDLREDPDEFENLVESKGHQSIREKLKRQLFKFYDEYAVSEYDLWKGGSSQVRIHDGIDEEISQLAAVQPPPLPDDFQTADVHVPDGFSVELVAGPPLVTHPTMACFDDQGRLYVCNNAGVNLDNEELEKQLPNTIRRLVDRDQDGKFDQSTVFADNMTFPMGGTWHDGSLYVASPPHIWRLRDTNDDGIADEREIIVTQFGYNGNAASIHGCFSGPDGRIHWTDGYHGHQFQDEDGRTTSRREGSYLFSCRPDGSDVRIHCGGGMDNPVELDFTDSGDMLGTVNILYTRPRVDALVHWLHGGAYPHRKRVLEEIKVTGDLLEPAHRFGHVAVSGMTRYRSAAMNHRWGDNLFATFFNLGKVVRLETEPAGSTFSVTQHEFLSSPSRDFHPTDVLEDADGSLLVIDTGGWFYRGCPTSQFSKPELLGGIYRVRRNGMTPVVDPRGLRIDWEAEASGSLIRYLNDTRFAVRQRAVAECARRGAELLPNIESMIERGDVRVRNNCVWVLTRLVQSETSAPRATVALTTALDDPTATIRQAACRGLAESIASVDVRVLEPLLNDKDQATRRTAAMALGRIGDARAIPSLLAAATNANADRAEQHAITYALIELDDIDAIRDGLVGFDIENIDLAKTVMIAMDQIDSTQLQPQDVFPGLRSENSDFRNAALRIIQRHPEWAPNVAEYCSIQMKAADAELRRPNLETLLSAFIQDQRIADLITGQLESKSTFEVSVALNAIATASSVPLYPDWTEPLSRHLTSDDEQQVLKAIAAVASIQGDSLSSELRELAGDQKQSMNVRLGALNASIAGRGVLEEETFALLLDWSAGSESVAAVSVAAQIIGSAKLTDTQFDRVTRLLPRAAPSQFRALLQSFSRTRNPEVIGKFLSATGTADAFLALAEHEFSDVIKSYPAEMLPAANELLDRLRSHHQLKQIKLESLRQRVESGDVVRGQNIFRSEKAQCSGCHRIGQHGNRVGPDLTTIGSNRSTDDLLESIVFPSASIVRDYESHKILTFDGRIFTGLLTSEDAESYVIQQATGEKVTILREDIDQVTPSAVSIMPAGLDEALSESELSDVVAYLKTLRQENHEVP